MLSSKWAQNSAGWRRDGPPQHPRGPLAVADAVLELKGQQDQARHGLVVEGLLIVGQPPELRDRPGVLGTDPGAEGVSPRVAVSRPCGCHQPPPVGLGTLGIDPSVRPVVEVAGELHGLGPRRQPLARLGRLGRVDVQPCLTERGGVLGVGLLQIAMLGAVAADRFEIGQQGVVGLQATSLVGGVGPLAVELGQQVGHPAPERGVGLTLNQQALGPLRRRERLGPLGRLAGRGGLGLAAEPGGVG